MTALTTFVALSPQHNNDRWYLLLVASCRVIVHNKSSVPIPRSHYSCKQNAQQACSYCQTTLFSTFPSFSRPTHPPPYVYVYVSSYVLPPLFFSFTFSFFFFHCFFCFVFFFLPSAPSLLLAIEVNHHLYYTTLQLINSMPDRKKNNPHLFSSLSPSLAKSQNKQAKNSELPRNPIWTPPWRLYGQLSQPGLE